MLHARALEVPLPGLDLAEQLLHLALGRVEEYCDGLLGNGYPLRHFKRAPFPSLSRITTPRSRCRSSSGGTRRPRPTRGRAFVRACSATAGSAIAPSPGASEGRSSLSSARTRCPATSSSLVLPRSPAFRSAASTSFIRRR